MEVAGVGSPNGLENRSATKIVIVRCDLPPPLIQP